MSRFFRYFGSLNPFMNQVYFYFKNLFTMWGTICLRLNPFMNQVYFYSRAL